MGACFRGVGTGTGRKNGLGSAGAVEGPGAFSLFGCRFVTNKELSNASASRSSSRISRRCGFRTAFVKYAGRLACAMVAIFCVCRLSNDARIDASCASIVARQACKSYVGIFSLYQLSGCDEISSPTTSHLITSNARTARRVDRPRGERTHDSRGHRRRHHTSPASPRAPSTTWR